jgi:hypothetical protein
MDNRDMEPEEARDLTSRLCGELEPGFLEGGFEFTIADSGQMSGYATLRNDKAQGELVDRLADKLEAIGLNVFRATTSPRRRITIFRYDKDKIEGFLSMDKESREILIKLNTK